MRKILPLLALAALPLVAIPNVAAAGAPPPAQGGPTPAVKKKALDLFKKGTELFAAKKFSEALAAFKESYDTLQSPNSHLYIARCYAQLGDARSAYAEFQKVADEADAKVAADPSYAQTRDSAKTERDEQAGKLSFLTLNLTHTDDTTTVTLGGKDVPRDQWGKPMLVDPGPTEIVVTSKSKPPVKVAMTLGAGEKKDYAFDVLAPPPGALGATPAGPIPQAANEPDKSRPNKTMRYASYVAGGVGVIGFGMFAIQGIRANSTYSDLQLHCGNQPCKANRQTEVSRGKVQQTMANIGLVVGALGVATGVTLFVLSSTKYREKTGEAAHETRVMVGPSSLEVVGTF